MNRHALLSLLALLLCYSTSLPAQKAKTYIPWKNGKLVVSEEGRYLKHENGVPFFQGIYVFAFCAGKEVE